MAGRLDAAAKSFGLDALVRVSGDSPLLDQAVVDHAVELFREGEYADFWWVLLDGAVDLIRRVGPEDTVVARMDTPGRWAGGFRAWDEQGVYLATGRVATPSRVLQIPASVLRERVGAWSRAATTWPVGSPHG